MSVRRDLPMDESPRDPVWVRVADWLLDDRPLVGVAVAAALFFLVLVAVNVWRVVA